MKIEARDWNRSMKIRRVCAAAVAEGWDELDDIDGGSRG